MSWQDKALQKHRMEKQVEEIMKAKDKIEKENNMSIE